MLGLGALFEPSTQGFKGSMPAATCSQRPFDCQLLRFTMGVLCPVGGQREEESARVEE